MESRVRGRSARRIGFSSNISHQILYFYFKFLYNLLKLTYQNIILLSIENQS